MELTGKCKVEFETFYCNCDDDFRNAKFNTEILADFNELPDSMKFGVLLDYFDSVNVIIEIPFYWGANNWKIEISEKVGGQAELMIEEGYNNSLKTRPEARTAAIEKANEIRNKQL